MIRNNAFNNSASFKVTTPSDREIVVTRDFSAPRQLVWDTMSKPELLKRWLFGPPGWEMNICEDDQRVGGQFKWGWKGPNGEEMLMTGEIHELNPPERAVRTERFVFGCNAQVGEQLATMVLAEKNGKTSMTLTLLYPSKEARDGAVASGMEHGMAFGYDRLDQMLEAGV